MRFSRKLNVEDAHAEGESGKVVLGGIGPVPLRAPRRVDDWCTLTGAYVEIRHQGTTVGRGIVDDVTHDGRILWLYSPVEGRRLYEKAGFYNAWATEERIGFHYKVSCPGA